MMRLEAILAATAKAAGRSVPTLRPTNKHFLDLDFLRGVAAVMVVLFHFKERAGLPQLMPHGYLAVDLFFVMSGFVLSHAYGARLASGALRFSSFALLRIFRFLPMICVGTILAAIIEFGRPNGLNGQHLRDTLASLLRGCLLIPSFQRTTLEPVLFPLDGPAWTLFFEMAASLGFALAVILRIPRGAVALLAAASAVWLGLVLVHGGSFAIAGVFPSTFAAGFPRVTLSVAVGVGLNRLSLPRLRVNRWVLATVVILVGAVPVLPEPFEMAFDAVAVLFVFPLIVLASISAPPQGSEPFLVRWSGRISYPLYATHYPIVRVVGFLLLRAPVPLAVRLVLVLACTVAIVLLAALCEIALDKPLQSRLRRLVRR